MKSKENLLQILQKELVLMHKAAEALERSMKQLPKLDHKLKYSFDEVDSLELLSSRFSRLTDFLIQRIFRLIDEIDLDPPGTVRDIINRAEKKGLIDNADILIESRILRNKIAHEYVESVMTEIFMETVRLVPVLLDAVHRIDVYTRRYC